MKQKCCIALSCVLYLSAAVLLAGYFAADLSPWWMLSPAGRVAVLLLACLLIYAGGLLLAFHIDARHRQKPLRVGLWIWFVLYLILLCTLTQFDAFFGRHGFSLPEWTKERFVLYTQFSMNLVPFRTIGEYIRMYFRGNIAPHIVFYNLFGNLVALSPFAFFLPLLFPAQQKWRVFVPTVAGVVLLIELLQFATLSGSCDIDDLILNVAGACALYAILRIPPVFRGMKKVFLRDF